jgi:rhodanese-related sulfurtransferase
MIWNFFKKLFNNSNQEELVKEAVKNKALLVDVRTKEEYNAGHVAGSINIPVNKLIDNLDKLKGHETIVLFCASGNRSRLALAILKNKDGARSKSGQRR